MYQRSLRKAVYSGKFAKGNVSDNLSGSGYAALSKEIWTGKRDFFGEYGDKEKPKILFKEGDE